MSTDKYSRRATVVFSELPFGSEFLVANVKRALGPFLTSHKEEGLFLRGSRAFLSS